MSALRPPELGPIVGHTTPRSCRLWIQSIAPDAGAGAPGGEGRSVGIIGVLSKSGKKVDKAYYFRLQREFDRSGAFMLGKDVALGRHAADGVPESQQDDPFTLLPDTEYTVRMATMLLDDPTPDTETLSDVELAKRLPQAFDPDIIGKLVVEISRSDGRQLRWPADDVAKAAVTKYDRVREQVTSALESSGVTPVFVVQPDALASKRQLRAVIDHFPTSAAQVPYAGRVLRAAQRLLDVSAVDLRDVFADEQRPVYADLVHTNERGARIVADALYPHLRSAVHAAAERR